MVGAGNTSESRPVAPGDVLADKYVVERTLGVGGMGVVVAARHLHIQHLVALKLLHSAAASDGIAVARFLREAQAAMSIQSEHVARVTDVGKLANGAPYLVMELLEGADLSRVLETRGRLGIDDAIGYLLQAMVAIAEAHALGIVHRDLKPSNLFLTERSDGEPLVKVLDFGISKTAATGPAGNLTRTSGTMGSPLYMAPEQIRSAKTVDRRADIWSLGVILQELLTGKTPFMADEVNGVLAAVVADPPLSARASRPDLPVGLEQVILRCLEKDPRARYGTVAELARALEQFASGVHPLVQRVVATALRKEGPASVQVPTMLSATPSTDPAVAATAGAWAQPTDQKTGFRKLRLAVVVAVVAVVGGVGLAVAPRLRASNDHAAPEEGSAARAPTEPPTAVVAPAAPKAPTPVPTEVAAPPVTAPPVATASANRPKAVPLARPGTAPKRPARPPTEPSRPKKSRDVSELIDDRR